MRAIGQKSEWLISERVWPKNPITATKVRIPTGMSSFWSWEPNKYNWKSPTAGAKT